MPKFICMQRKLPAPAEGSTPPPSPAQMQEMYSSFSAWKERFEANIVDLGGKLGAGTLVGGQDTDGPLVEVKELVGGYMILQTSDLDEAVAIASAIPGLVKPGSGVEVVEIHAPGS